MIPNADIASSDYALAVTARQQADQAVVIAMQALNEANTQVATCRLNEEIAMFNLGIAVGIPNDKMSVSAECKVALGI